MKFKGKSINRRKPTPVIEDVKTVAETVIKSIRTEPVSIATNGSGLSKQDKIDRIKTIVLSDQINNKSIERLNKFINFSIK
jgi:hypothetical protein